MAGTFFRTTPTIAKKLQMKKPDENGPYWVDSKDGKSKVLDDEGNVVLVCANSANAEHYAALMNQSYRRGYKAGIRSTRKH